ncbi:MAG: hypothetical protein BM564_07730 [Bacteroidetes bacterium MedPE-SWsnd-G2]|nr:MAG: hypothetical protein BM564_07730 [Bacteroidetes bacterium MedPE-SWsnd-G2]
MKFSYQPPLKFLFLGLLFILLSMGSMLLWSYNTLILKFIGVMSFVLLFTFGVMAVTHYFKHKKLMFVELNSKGIQVPIEHNSKQQLLTYNEITDVDEFNQLRSKMIAIEWRETYYYLNANWLPKGAHEKILVELIQQTSQQPNR